MAPESTWEAACKYWRSFLPAWLYPLYLFVVSIMAGQLGGAVSSLLIIVPFFAVFIAPAVLWAKQKLRLRDLMLLGPFGTFAIWVILLAGVLLIDFLTR